MVRYASRKNAFAEKVMDFARKIEVEQAFGVVRAEHNLVAGHFDCLRDVDWGTQLSSFKDKF